MKVTASHCFTVISWTGSCTVLPSGWDDLLKSITCVNAMWLLLGIKACNLLCAKSTKVRQLSNRYILAGFFFVWTFQKIILRRTEPAGSNFACLLFSLNKANKMCAFCANMAAIYEATKSGFNAALPSWLILRERRGTVWLGMPAAPSL